MKKGIALIFVLTILLSAIPFAHAAASDKIPVIVGFKDVPNEAIIQACGGTAKFSYTHIKAVAADLPAQAVEALQRNPLVAYVEPDYKAEILAETVGWGVSKINAPQAWSTSTGENVKVAILDTGIDYDHPDLADNYIGGIDYINNDDYPMDDNGHGTHCAGIVAAIDNDIGVVGVAPQADLYAVKVLDARGSGAYSIIAAGIDWSITNGMDVISMSLGGSFDSTTLRTACNAAQAAGIVVVASAGNSGPRLNSIGYPAKYSSVIAVGATDSNDVVASFSSRGTQLSVAAPGVSIYSTYYGDTYATMSGTSMACPHVSGTVALLLAAGANPTEIRSILQSTAVDLGTAGFDTNYGYGRIDAAEAVAKSVPTLTVSITNPQEGATLTDSVTIQATVANAQLSLAVTYAIDSETAAPMTLNTLGGAYEATWDTTLEEDGTHTITVTANDGTTDSDSVTVTVDNIPNAEKTLSVAVATDKDLYTKNSFVTITVTVKDTATSNPIAGASVTVQVEDPNGKTTSILGTTNSEGQPVLKYKVGPKAPSGPYSIYATASFSGYLPGTAEDSFSV